MEIYGLFEKSYATLASVRDLIMEILLIIYMIMIGAMVGLLSGFFGIGGGILIVPIISYFYTFQAAICISLGVMVVSSAITALLHWRANNISWQWVLKLLPGMIVGVVAGIFLHHVIHANSLKIVLYFIMIIVGLQFFFNEKTSSASEPKVYYANAYGCFLGVLSGLLGIGVGSFCVPYLVYYKASLSRSSAIVSICTLGVSFLGFMMIITQKSFTPMGNTHLFWEIFIAIVLSACIVSPLAVNISHKLDGKLLKRIFASLLIVFGLAMLSISVI